MDQSIAHAIGFFFLGILLIVVFMIVFRPLVMWFNGSSEIIKEQKNTNSILNSISQSLEKEKVS